MKIPYDVYIVGLGIVGYRQVTRETEQVLSLCSAIFFLHNESEVTGYLQNLCPKVVDLYTEYRIKKPRDSTYKAIAAKVIKEAKRNPPVALAVYGHPLVYVKPSRILIDRCPDLGLRVKVLPGVSAMDCLYVDLKLDPSAKGIQMYEATDALLKQHPLQPDVPCILWQIGALETRLHLPYNSKPHRFKRIKEYLMKFYPPKHKLTIATTSTNLRSKSSLITFPLDEFEDMHKKIKRLATLYIPPVSQQSIKDHELDAIMDTKEYIASIIHVK